MKKIWTVALLLLTLMGLVACGGNAEAAGKYICVEIDGDDDVPSGTYIQLEEKGAGIFNVGLELDLDWELEGTAITIETSFIENTYTGTLDDGVLTVTIEDAVYTFVRSDLKNEWLAAQTNPVIAASTEAQPVDEAAVGHYTCSTIREGGTAKTVNGEWVDLKADGSAVFFSGISFPGLWYSIDGAITLELNTGSIYVGTLTASGLRLEEDDLVYTFALADGETATGNTTESPLRPGTSWSGTIKITNHRGSGAMERGTFDIVAYLKERGDFCYFEIYYAEETTDEPIICFPVELHKNYFEPIIGSDAEDGWIFDNRMTSSDVWDFTMFLRDENEITAYYEYANTYETADIDISLYPDA